MRKSLISSWSLYIWTLEIRTLKLAHKIALFLITVVTFLSCGEENKFKVHESGLLYKVIKESENKKELNIGDYVELELRYMTETDSVLFNSKEFGGPLKMQLNSVSHQGGSFEDALLMMNPGDWYQFKIPTDSFYLYTKKEYPPAGISNLLLFDIKVIRQIPKEEIEKERQLFEEQMKQQEEIVLEQYIQDREIKAKPKESGLYFIETKRGKGSYPKQGDSLFVHYTGSLLNGKIFDSSYNRGEAFAFKLGAKDVIDGWEEGFKYMKKGGKALFVIPSALAYGKVGYSTIIPPYSSLLFEVELIEIKHNK